MENFIKYILEIIRKNKIAFLLYKNKRKGESIMKKIFLGIALILMLGLMLTGCKDKNPQNVVNNNNQNNNIPQNALVLDATTAISKIDEKTFEITPSESGEIIVDLKKTSGSVEVEITDGQGYIVELYDGEFIDEDGEVRTTYVEEGNGTYTVKVTTDEFVGNYDIRWVTANTAEIETFESTQGYTINYDKTKFETRQSEGYDYFISTATDNHVSEDEEQFMAISIVPAENAEQVKSSILTEDARIGDAVMANSTLYGKFVETRSDDSNMVKRTFVMDLEGGKVLLIEQNYLEHFESSAVTMRFSEMCESIKIK